MPRDVGKLDSQPIASGSIVSVEDFSHEKFVVERILRGGMGIDYQLVPVRPVLRAMALKTYLDAADSAKFESEARSWISLGTHPNIAQAHWYGKWYKQPAVLAHWYSTALSEADIRDWTTDRILSLALQMIEGLDFAFKQVGLIHRDVKPSNVLLDEFGASRIADFGVALLAKPLSEEIQKNSDEHRMVRTGGLFCVHSAGCR